LTIDIHAAVLRSTGLPQPYGASLPLQIEAIQLAPPGDHEVLVRIEAASLCRSDLSVITGTRAWPLPIVPGHEASGVVEEIGSNVSRVRPGDHVVLVYQPECGHCAPCRSGRVHLCEPGLAANRAGKLLTGDPHLGANGEVIHHHMGVSAFAERAVLAENSLVAVDPEIDMDIAALFGCAVMCGAGSVINSAKLVAGETIAIVGVGGVGSSAILGANLAGAERIVAVDTDAEKRANALSLGASEAVEGGPGAAGEILALTGGGVDCAFEAAGTVEAFATAYNSVKRGGRIITVGLVDPETPFSLDIAGCVTGAKTIIGSYMGSCNPAQDIPRFAENYKRGKFPVDRLISGRMPLRDINLALDRMADSKGLRQILKPHA
jgi:alcohol dehydrogenase